MSRSSNSKCDAAVTLRAPAISFRQSRTRQLFSFIVDGKQLDDFCTVSRIARKTAGGLHGYQRPEVLSHVSQIQAYLESQSPMLPNSIVVAFESSVRFVPIDRSSQEANVRFGWLEIPLKDRIGNAILPGWIVDGQQRAAALRQANLSDFPVSVVGFMAHDVEDQREQFILVNAVKPLPRGLLFELLPETTSRLPARLESNRAASAILTRINNDADSPFYNLIRTPTCCTGVIADASILKMLRNSLSDGALYDVSNHDERIGIVKSYWNAVRAVFPTAWAVKPKQSRLMHGAGIVAMGLVMDSVVATLRRSRKGLTTQSFKKEVQLLEPVCHWTTGSWSFADGSIVNWNKLQNTPSHIQLLCRHLTVFYHSLKK